MIQFSSGFYLVSPKVSLVCLTDARVPQADDGLLHVHLNPPDDAVSHRCQMPFNSCLICLEINENWPISSICLQITTKTHNHLILLLLTS